MRNRRVLPPNLYGSKKNGRVYYQYRHPITNKFQGLGTDRLNAVNAAMRLNGELAKSRHTVEGLVRRVMGGGKTVGDALDLHRKHAEERGLAANTLRTLKTHAKAIREHMGDVQIVDVTTAMVAEFIGEVKATGTERKAQALRTLFRELFRDAIAEGWTDKDPAAVTRGVSAKVKRGRLTLDQFKAIHAAAGALDPWIGNAMLLALLTGQRPSDIATMRFKDIDNGWLLVTQQKTGNRLRLSLDLRLDCVGMSLGQLVRACRDGVVSPYLIHHTKNRTFSKRGGAIHKQTISKGFRRARDIVVKETGLTWAPRGPATFAEIRSLAGRLYKKQGVDPQALLGHKHAATTDIYLDARKAEWITVAMS